VREVGVLGVGVPRGVRRVLEARGHVVAGDVEGCQIEGEAS
jgi:hypothetical protein